MERATVVVVKRVESGAVAIPTEAQEVPVSTEGVKERVKLVVEEDWMVVDVPLRHKCKSRIQFRGM